MALFNLIVLISLLPVHIPGPFIGKFSNIWLALGAQKGQKYAWGKSSPKSFASLHAAHQRHGKIVRVGFNHVSIATPESLRTVYAHNNGLLKDIFYEAFIPGGVPDVFSSRDRGDHARKRRLIANAFSPGAVHDFEPYMSSNLQRWVAQLDRIAANPGRDGYARVDMKPWCTFLAFDIIGDLAFGTPFGMVQRGRDECELILPGQPATYVPGAESLNRRGQVNSCLGLLPALRPWAGYLPHPFFYKGLRSKENLHGIAAAAVTRRLESTEGGQLGTRQHRDILEMLRRGKDAEGNPMGRNELVAEAHVQLIAGSDTVSSTSCAAIYWMLDGERRNPGTIVPRLQAELDGAIGSNSSIAAHGEVKNLRFLRLCIDEAMRLHSTSATGLPRIVTGKGGVTCENEHFPSGTVLSVPSYTLHHSADIWGPDVEEFKPERWLHATPQQRSSFNPFSYGPRACVGQNVAHMELALIIGTAFHRYDFRLYQQKLESLEGFSKKPAECWVGIRLRNTKAQA
ncbi:cytochrome p450 benzoate 4-monooxygenase [Xylaria acuta]|nr:cytochrome p450 benzoate 4-monooxygenase [Xylaria acuta]